MTLGDLAQEAYESAYERSHVETVKREAAAKAEEAKSAVASGYETAKQRTSSAVQSVAHKVGEAAESAKQGLQAAGDKTRSAVEHTKEQVSKTTSEWQEELQPHSIEEAKLAAGEIPSDTQSVLASKGETSACSWQGARS